MWFRLNAECWKTAKSLMTKIFFNETKYNLVIGNKIASRE